MTNAQHAARAKRRKAPPSPSVEHYRDIRAAILDREADFELQLGHHLAAERLAHRAAELREPGR